MLGTDYPQTSLTQLWLKLLNNTDNYFIKFLTGTVVLMLIEHVNILSLINSLATSNWSTQLKSVIFTVRNSCNGMILHTQTHYNACVLLPTPMNYLLGT